jgi:hypothetical protein
MFAQSLATQILAAVRLAEENRDTHVSEEAGYLMSTRFDDGVIRVLLPPGYGDHDVITAAELLRKERVQVRVRRLSCLEQMFTERFSGMHGDLVYDGVPHRWKIFAIPLRSIKVGMPRSYRRRLRTSFA